MVSRFDAFRRLILPVIGSSQYKDNFAGSYYIDYDFSAVLGDLDSSVCSPIWLQSVFDHSVYEEEEILQFPQSHRDCNEIGTAIDHSPEAARSLMKHSVQSVGRFAGEEKVIGDFGLERVVNSLERLGRETLLERGDPRILACADNLGLELCSNISSVFTSEGFSIGINARNSSSFLLDDDATRQTRELFGENYKM